MARTSWCASHMVGGSRFPDRPSDEATGQAAHMVLLATILACHALAGDTGWWRCGGQAPHRRDDSHELLSLLWRMPPGPLKHFILHKPSPVVDPATPGEVKRIGDAVATRPLTVVTTCMGSPSSGQGSVSLQTIFYYINYLM